MGKLSQEQNCQDHREWNADGPEHPMCVNKMEGKRLIYGRNSHQNFVMLFESGVKDGIALVRFVNQAIVLFVDLTYSIAAQRDAGTNTAAKLSQSVSNSSKV